MQRHSTPLFPLTLTLALLGACTNDGGAANDDDASDGSSGGADEAVDDLPTAMPVPTGWRELEFPEQIIPAGSEKQNCWFLEFEKDELYSDALRSFQGKYGHHILLFYTTAPEPAGTVRDCTGAADMVTLVPAITSTDFGVPKFPDGMAVRIPKGTQLVVQQHYVNTSDKPIRVKDVLQFSIVPEAQVTQLVGLLANTDVDFEITPDPELDQKLEFDCVVPRDMKLLVTTPHMHEWGTLFTSSITKQSGEEIVLFDHLAWKAEYRDKPPKQEWNTSEPLELKTGDSIHTECTYRNNTGETLEFPREMCALSGYYYPAPRGEETWTCTPE